MPRQEHVLTVFVASPGDVGDERTRLEEVIRELNVTWSRELGVRLDLVRWETHAYPGMGDDAQDVINEQIPDDYDLFVGIMWCRYGTPTGRAGSGTVEEFRRAKARYDADPSSVKLMVYFKDEPIPPSRLDPSQLSKVNEFRDSLGDEGALYWKFTSVDQFEKLIPFGSIPSGLPRSENVRDTLGLKGNGSSTPGFHDQMFYATQGLRQLPVDTSRLAARRFIRLHLTRQVQAWKSQRQESASTATQKEPTEQPAQQPETESEEDDLGILDLVEIFEDRFDELRNISERIGKATEDLGQKMTDRTAEMNQLPRDPQGNVNRNVAKRFISKAAADMDQYTARIEAELPLFSDSLNTGMNALIRAVTMSVDLDTNEADAEQAKDALNAIVTLRGVLTTTQESMNGFRETVAGLPRMTSELNRAKRGLVSVVNRLIDEFTTGQTLLRESETVVRDLPARKTARRVHGT